MSRFGCFLGTRHRACPELAEGAPGTPSASRRRLLLAAAGLVLALAVTYSGLSIYKAIDYTTTPRQPPFAVFPDELGMPYEDVAFPSARDAGVTLRGWWMPNGGSNQVVILVHGRYQNRTSHLDVAQALWRHGYNVLAFDLRGHGSSTREPCSYGLEERWDVLGAARFVQQRGYSPASIGVLGWSLGATSALLALGESDDIAAVVSDSAYADDGPLLARNALRPGLKLAMRLVRGVDLDALDGEQAVARLGERHVLLIHGERDVAVPVEHAYRLQRAGGASVSDLWIVPDAGHIQAYPTRPDEYVQRVTAFFDVELT